MNKESSPIDNEPFVVIEPEIREDREPIVNLLARFNWLYKFIGAVTNKKGRFDRSKEHTRGREYPMFLRRRRAELLADLKNNKTKDEKRAILREAHYRDELARQHLNQRVLTVKLPELGDQSVRYIDLVPPKELDQYQPPIFFIPGASNDIECVGSLAHEAALRGRRVIVVAYPESFNGHTTQEFSNAVAVDDCYGPHVAFFKAALKHLLGKCEKIEIWGYSTGAPIAAAILKESEWQKRTQDCVFICPASTVNQTLGSVKRGAASDVGLFKKFKSSANFVFSTGGKKPKTEQLKLREKIFESLLRRVAKLSPDWDKVGVVEDGNITIVNGRKDKITKSASAHYLFNKNPKVRSKVRSIDLIDGFHTTPLAQPKRVIDLIFAE